MKRITTLLAAVALGALFVTQAARAGGSFIGGHVETSENLTALGGWTTANMSPGSVLGAPSAPHLVFSEVAVRGAGTGTLSDSSEYIEIYNPTTMPVVLDNYYISDDIGYYRIVNGTYPAAQTSDWALRFPAGLSLSPGRVLLLCVTKAGFAGSGAVLTGVPQYFLEMRDTNANTTDDMILMTTGSSFLVTGGSLTNASTSNGEWVVLYRWNGTSDLVCDVDYASWGANSASNPKMDKTGITIDGPDAGAAASAYAADVAAAGQTNLGTAALAKPNTYQRLAGEVGELPAGGNGCRGRASVAGVDWVTNAGVVRFHIRWANEDPDNSTDPATAMVHAQEFGVFLPDMGLIQQMDVPPMQPNSFFDVFFDVPLTALPPSAPIEIPTGSPSFVNPCPPPGTWAGNLDIVWSGPGYTGQILKHYGEILVCPGGAPSYIHVGTSNCPNPAPWAIAGLCPGFSATLVNEDKSPAPNPVPPGWTGWICVSAGAVVPVPTTCCFTVNFTCNGSPATIDICATTCDCGPRRPTLAVTDWTHIGTIERFHMRWENNDPNISSGAVSGDMNSQPFGVFASNFGPIGHFDIPPIVPNSFFDVFFDIPLASLPPGPSKQLPGGGGPQPSLRTASTTTGPCPPDTAWDGNVDITWDGAGGSGHVNKHVGDLDICPGAGPSYIHVLTFCTVATGSTWAISGLCPGFNATLVNEDKSPAPNPVPAGWTGFICVTSPAGTLIGINCCFQVTFDCGGVPGVIELCARTCDCGPPKPTLTGTDWTHIGPNERFHMRWENTDPAQASAPVSGSMSSQPFGVFASNFGPIGAFNVPPIAPNSFFDVFFDIATDQLPAPPQKLLPGGGAAAGSSLATSSVAGGPCPPDTAWDGNVDITWSGAGGSGHVNKHVGDLEICPGSGPSYIHVLTFCTVATGSTWAISGLCPGFNATLVNEDKSPAPNPVPPGWTGFICVTSPAGTLIGLTCCFQVTFDCGGVPGVIELCAHTCDCQRRPHLSVVDWTNIGPNTRFHMRWENPDPAGASDPVSGNMSSQPFGVFASNFGPIGAFNVPPIAPNSFFDVFFDIATDQLPAPPQKLLPSGSAAGDSPTAGSCPPDTAWDGNVDITWSGAGGSGQVNKHVGDLDICPGVGASLVHVLTFCTVATGSNWVISGLCPGFSATLVNEDFTPAPNPVPPGWTGFISVSAAAAVPVPTTCCFKVTFDCGGVPGVIDLCATTCQCGSTGVPPIRANADFGIFSASPNPTTGAMVIDFGLPRTSPVRLEVFDLSGKRVRVLMSGETSAGITSVRWDGLGEKGLRLPPGTYFITLRGEGRLAKRKVVLFH
jgi:hypothetical protein